MTVRSQLLTLAMRVAIGLRTSINRIAVLVEDYTLIRDVGVYAIPDTSIPESLQGHPQGAIVVHQFFLLDSAQRLCQISSRRVSMKFQRGDGSRGSPPARVPACESSRQVAHLLLQQLGVASSSSQAIDRYFSCQLGKLLKLKFLIRTFSLVLPVSRLVMMVSDPGSL